MKILGIDPGLSGALALLAPGGLSVFDVPTMKARTRGREVNWPEVARWIDAAGHIDYALIEQVGARPGQGVSSMFKFGYVAGGLRGVVAAHFIPITMVTPQSWKRAMAVPKEKDGARARASDLFPSHCDLFVRVKDHGRAEASLIALWGQRSLAVPPESQAPLFGARGQGEAA